MNPSENTLEKPSEVFLKAEKRDTADNEDNVQLKRFSGVLFITESESLQTGLHFLSAGLRRY